MIDTVSLVTNSDDEEFAGLENLDINPKIKLESDRIREAVNTENMFSSTVCGNQQKGNECVLHVRTSGDHSFRIYFPSSTEITASWVNQFCRLLDSRTENDTIHFILGSHVDDYRVAMMGSVISALQNCKAITIGEAAGYCSLSETMIWTFCKYHRILRYGALTFGVSDFIKEVPAYKAYFDVFLKHAVQIGAITEEEYQIIWKTKRDLFLMYQDFPSRLSEPTPTESNN